MIRIAPIVEGHGEVTAVPALLRRIGDEVLNGTYLDVLRPVRRPRSKILPKAEKGSVPNEDELCRAMQFAQQKLANAPPCQGPSAVLLMLDGNSDCARTLAPALMKVMLQAGGAARLSVVLPVVEFESWFVGCAGSLQRFLEVSEDDAKHCESPESHRCGKSWIERRFKNGKYSETVDQVRLAAHMDLTVCRQRCPSFDKLCRELEALL